MASAPKVEGIEMLPFIRQTYTGSGGAVSSNIFVRKTGSSGSGSQFAGGAINQYTTTSSTGHVPLNSSGQLDVSWSFSAPSADWQIAAQGYIDNNL